MIELDETPTMLDLLNVANKNLADTNNAELIVDTPTVSIVTIFDRRNAETWLSSYMASLPTIAKESIGEIEVILCETIRDDSIDNNGVKPIISEDIVKGLVIKRTEYLYKGEFNYADARNAAKYFAKGAWIMSLDTDEFLLSAQLPELVDMVANLPICVGGVNVTVFSHILNGDNFEREALPAIRLFRNVKGIVWQSQIHEFVNNSIARAGYLTRDSTITIFHRGYECSKHDLIGKLNRNKVGLMREVLTSNDEAVRQHANLYLDNTVIAINKFKGE